MAALLGFGVVVVAGCSQEAEPLPDVGSTLDHAVDGAVEEEAVTDIVEFDEMAAEFRAATGDYELPDGFSFVEPVDPGPETLPDGTEGESVYERGVGDVMAFDQWQCIWQQHWLEVRESEPEAADHALAVLNTAFDNPTFIKFYDPLSSVPRREEMLEKAALGDPSMVQHDLEFNCST